MKSNTHEQHENTHRFLVVGSPDCGKTTILDYYCNPENKPAKVQKTVGCEVHLKEIFKERDNSVKQEFVEFWDLSGEIKCQPQVKVYTHAHGENLNTFKGIIFFFDMNNIKSLLSINKYLKELMPQQTRLPLLIVGNKFDLIKENDRETKSQTIKEYLNCIFDYNPCLRYIFVSKKFPIGKFEDLDLFLRDCIDGEIGRLNIFDASKELYSHDKFINYTKKTLESLGKDLRRVHRLISTNPLHLPALGAFLTLTLSINVFFQTQC